MPFNTRFLTPFEHCDTGHFGPIVADNGKRLAALFNDGVLTRDPTLLQLFGEFVCLFLALCGLILQHHFHGKIVGRDEAAARIFFIRTIENNGLPEKVVIDKSGSNLAGLTTINCCLLLCGWWQLIDVLRVKYLNNIIEQDHRIIKKLTRPLKGFKSFHSASSTLQGIEVAHMIRKKQFGIRGQSGFKQFAALAG